MPRYRSKEPQVVRCLVLLRAMAQAKRGVNLRQFAERRGWNSRTTYRDVETLRAAGVPIEHSEHGWYRVAGNWLPAGTADIKHDELLALYVARCVAPGLKDTAFGRGLDGLWSKLASPGGQQVLSLGDEALIASRSLAAIDYAPHRMILDIVCEAMRRRRALWIRYRKPDGAETERVVEPAFMHYEPSSEGLYVFAWCRMREQYRTFAIHRISFATVTDEEFVRRREAIVELSKAYRLWSRPQVEHVTLRFTPHVAGEIRERRWHRTQQMTDTADGGVILEMDIAAPEELERLLLGYGADVVVEEPLRLAERIRERHAEALGAQHLPALSVRRARRSVLASKRVRTGRKVGVH